MSSLLTYLRAAQPKPGLKSGESIPRIETTIKSHPADRKLYNGLRRLWDLPDYGVMPPVFPAVATFMAHLKHLTDPKFPFQAMGTVHIRTSIDQVRPLRVDEMVSYRCWVEGHREVDQGLEFDLMTESLVGGHVISSIKMTMLRRGKRKHRPGIRPPQAIHNHLEAHNQSWTVEKRMARQYAKLTGDINPIHLSSWTAKALGFKGMMLHGMWLLGRACAMHPIQMMANSIHIETEFKLPVILPAALRYRWWEDQGKLEMRVLDESGTKHHMIARLETQKN